MGANSSWRLDNMTERGQAYTLEGIIGAIILASALVIGLQAVDPAPWTEPDPDDPEDIRAAAEGTLAIADDRDLLRAAVTCVDQGEYDERAFEAEDSPLRGLFERTLDGYSYEVWYEYHNYTDGSTDRISAREEVGTPGRQSATVTRQVPLFSGTLVHTFEDGECKPSDTTLEESDIYIENQHPDKELYAVVTIRVIAW